MNEEDLTAEEANPEKGLDKDIEKNTEKLNKEYQEQKYGNKELRKKQEEEKRIDEALKERPGETSIQRKQRLSREMGRNYKGRETRTDAEIQSEGNLKGEPTYDETFRKKTPEEIAEAEKGVKEAKRIIEQGKKDRGEDYDPNFAFEGNAFLSAGFEITANTILDIFSPILPLQSGGSYVINLISQIIRDPSKIGSLNQLEAGAAAASSLIPGANQYASFLKGIKPATRGTQLVRQIGRGAVSANLDVAGMRIGEGEELTFEDLTAATVFGGGLGGIVGVTPDLIKGKGQITGDLSKVFRNIRKRIDGTLPGNERITPEGFNFGQATPEFEPTTVFQIKKGSRKGIPSNPEEKAALEAAGQKDVFKSFKEDPRLGVSDEAIYEQYQALYKKYDDRTLGDTIDEGLTNKQKREKYGRKLKSTDLDLIIQEEGLKGNTIPPEKAQEYVDLVNDTRLGKKDRNNPSGRLRRNQKGYIGTMVYLNEVSLGINPNTLGNTADVIKHISKEMGTDPIGLKRIIEGQGGEISFQTEGMTAPKKIRSLKELVEAYHLRLSRYKEIPAFEKGHVFAANNIIEDRDINSLTDFYNNLEPEISRSIREQLDEEAIEQLIKSKKKVKGDDFYRSVVEGNRKRQNKQDPDKILADLLGTQYGLRESFLTFVYPERSLSNLIPIESKAAFAELYRKELLAEIKGIKADLKNSGQSSIGPARIDLIKMRVAKEVAETMKNNKILDEIILMDDKINKRPMTEQGEAKPLRDDPIKTEPDGTIKGDTPDQ